MWSLTTAKPQQLSHPRLQVPRLLLVVDEDGEGVQHLKDVYRQRHHGTWIALPLRTFEHVGEALGTLRHSGGRIALVVAQGGDASEALILEVQRRVSRLPPQLAANLLLVTRCAHTHGECCRCCLSSVRCG